MNPMGTQCTIFQSWMLTTLQIKPEASPLISKDAAITASDPVCTCLNMTSKDLKRNNLSLEILAHEVHFLLQDTYCSY